MHNAGQSDQILLYTTYLNPNGFDPFMHCVAVLFAIYQYVVAADGHVIVRLGTLPAYVGYQLTCRGGKCVLCEYSTTSFFVSLIFKSQVL